MSLVTEDGSGLANAESYASVTTADARLTALGLTIWLTLTADQKEAALRRATRHMLQVYRGRWIGRRVHLTQALDWPRYDVCVDNFPIAINIVPADIANACTDLALKAAAGDLTPDLERAVVREKVGPIETEYDRFSSQAARLRSIDLTLSPYLSGSSAMAQLVRS